MLSLRFSRRAFTLVELLVTIAIATILASVVLSTLQGLLKDQKLSQSVRLVRQYFETARTRAIATGRPVALFLERQSPEGDSAGNPVVTNYTVTRMSIGEVFPPYTGEVTLATATLWDTPVGSPTAVTTRLADGTGHDGFADQARFLLAEVVTAFGTATSPGMVSVGDTIEFSGNQQRFVIESIDYVGGEVAVTFFNPPANYDSLLATKIQSGTATDTKFEVGYSGREPTLRTSSTLTGMLAPTPTIPPPPAGVQFRIYRKPSKSLVGTITMPRGTCIDLSVSGLGPISSAWDATSPFHLATAPAGTLSTGAGTLKRSSYSRIAVLFNPEGRAHGMYQDNRIVGMGTPEVMTSYVPFGLSTKLHFMVGRTEQVIPDVPVTAPAVGDRGDQLGNLMDTANTWVSINPFTGLIESSPVAAVSDATRAAAQTAFTSGNAAAKTQAVHDAVAESRRLSATGVNDGGR